MFAWPIFGLPVEPPLPPPARPTAAPPPPELLPPDGSPFAITGATPVGNFGSAVFTGWGLGGTGGSGHVPMKTPTTMSKTTNPTIEKIRSFWFFIPIQPWPLDDTSMRQVTLWTGNRR